MLSALISLELPIDDGHDFNSTYTRPGLPRVSRIGCYYDGDECLTNNSVKMHALAHTYGEMTLATDRGSYSDISGLLESKHDFRIWSRPDWTESAHRFNEYNEIDTQRSYPYFTDRVITSSSGECIEYQVDEKAESVTMGDIEAWKLTYRNASFQDTITIPKSALGLEGTTYIYHGHDDPFGTRDPKVVCGKRCMYMWVYKNPGGEDGPRLYQCPITISNVRNANHPEYEIPDGVARVAAVSIALQGQWHGSFQNQDYHQYQFYASG